MTDNPLLGVVLERIRSAGAITVAEYMDIALYDPKHGYYGTVARRSGGQGDFYTSVDAGALFGEMIAVQLAEMWTFLHEHGAQGMDLVEAGAGDGRLTRDILAAVARHHGDLYDRLRVTLVERSKAACACHTTVLGAHAAKYSGSTDVLPRGVTGVVIANELIDALPVHVIAGSHSGLREIYIGERNGMLVEIDGPLSSGVADYVRREQIALDPGTRTEVGIRAVHWMADAATSLEAGFLLLFDYALPASALYSNARTAGTLTSYHRHTIASRSWLGNPGSVDITAHVNLTAIMRAAEAAGLTSLGITDQTYFLLSLGLAERLSAASDAPALAARLSAKTLMMPGGLGSTMKVLAFAKAIGRPALRGFASARLT